MPGECVLVCERAGAPVIRVTVFTFPLRCTGAQAAHGEGGALDCAVSSHKCMYVCVCMGVLGRCAQDYCSAIILGLSQRRSHEPGGLWVLLVPTEWKGAAYFFHSLFLFSAPHPHSPPTTKVFIDYLSLLFNNLILGDSALCSHCN